MRFAHKMLLIPLLAAVCFAAVLVVDSMLDGASADLIDDIRSGYLPALELSRKIESSLVSVERKLEGAVAAADPEGLTAADAAASTLVRSLQDGRTVSTLPPNEVLILEGLFRRYYADARSTAERMMRHEAGDTLQPALERLAGELKDFHARIEAFTTAQQVDLDIAIARAQTHQRRGERTMQILLGLGLVVLTVVTHLVFRSTVGAVRQACADAAAVLARSSSSTSVPPANIAHDDLAALLASLRDTADALSGSEERYRHLFDANPLPMWLFDVETFRFLTVNDATVRQYGYSRDELLSMSVFDIRPPAERERLRNAIPGLATCGTIDAGLWIHLRKDGSLVDVEITSHVLTLAGRTARLIVAHDVTEKRRLEQQLRQSHKMEAVGRLAAGVAHDFNNVLNVIMGYTEMIERRWANDVPLRGKADEILKAVGRASSLTRQLLTFSRQHAVEPRLLDLNVVITDVSKMLRRLIGEDIDLRLRLAPDLGAVKADPGQMEQVVMNLCVNARDAMADGGTITIETREVERKVILEVTDTGCGMDADTRSRLFEPFFTTKAEGKGTGLGLATVYGIVQNSGGHIEVESEKGRGTTFNVSLPRVEGKVRREILEVRASTPDCAGETILLVEDEELVREMIVDTLEQSGYRVLPAATPWQALAMAESHKGTIDLVLTDVIMPGLTGLDVAERLKALRPGVPVVYMSGYSDETIGKYRLDPEQFLLKPFTTETLLRRMREQIHGRHAPASLGISAA